RVAGGLHRQLPDALKDGVAFVQRALGHLQQRDAVLRVALRLPQTPDLRPHALGDGQARRVVRGPVDAQARGQLLHGPRHAVHVGDVLPVDTRVVLWATSESLTRTPSM